MEKGVTGVWDIRSCARQLAEQRGWLSRKWLMVDELLVLRAEDETWVTVRACEYDKSLYRWNCSIILFMFTLQNLACSCVHKQSANLKCNNAVSCSLVNFKEEKAIKKEKEKKQQLIITSIKTSFSWSILTYSLETRHSKQEAPWVE